MTTIRILQSPVSYKEPSAHSIIYRNLKTQDKRRSPWGRAPKRGPGSAQPRILNYLNLLSLSAPHLVFYFLKIFYMPRKRKNKKGGKVPKAVKQFVDKKMDAGIENKVIAYHVPAGVNLYSTDPQYYGLLGNIAQGNLTSQRLGAKINLRSIRLLVSTSPNIAVGATQPQYVRFIVFRDKKVNGAGLLVNDLLWGGTVGSATNYLRPYNPLQVGKGRRLQILKDFLITNHVEGGASNLSGGQTRKYFKKFAVNMPCQFRGDGVGTANVISGEIYLMICHSDASLNVPFINYSTLLEYEDA